MPEDTFVEQPGRPHLADLDGDLVNLILDKGLVIILVNISVNRSRLDKFNHEIYL
jgi:hypothetical protein